MRNEIKFGVFGLFAIFLFYGIFLITSTSSVVVNEPIIDEPVVEGDGVVYHASVWVQHYRPGVGVLMEESSSNIVTNAGLNAIADVVQGTPGAAFDWIGLCNATTGTSTTPCVSVVAGDIAIDTEYTTAGLDRVQGTILDLSQVGNTSISTTFTATANSLTTNQTGLFNATSGATLIAGNDFTLVTLQTNDQLTVNWTIWFTSA